MLILQVLLAVIAIASLLAAAWAIWASWHSPMLLVEINLGEGGDQRPPWWKPGWQHYLLVVLIFIGFGMMVYGGVRSALFWLPESWGRIDEDGDWASYRDILSGTLAVLGSLAILAYIFGVARIRYLQMTADSAKDSQSDANL